MHVNNFMYIPKFMGDDHAGYHVIIETTQIISYIIHAWMHVKVSTM